MPKGDIISGLDFFLGDQRVLILTKMLNQSGLKHIQVHSLAVSLDVSVLVNLDTILLQGSVPGLVHCTCNAHFIFPILPM